jgi:hypothetical protein
LYDASLADIVYGGGGGGGGGEGGREGGRELCDVACGAVIWPGRVSTYLAKLKTWHAVNYLE